MLLIMQGPGDIQEGGSYQSITQRVRFVWSVEMSAVALSEFLYPHPALMLEEMAVADYAKAGFYLLVSGLLWGNWHHTHMRTHTRFWSTQDPRNKPGNFSWARAAELLKSGVRAGYEGQPYLRHKSLHRTPSVILSVSDRETSKGQVLELPQSCQSAREFQNCLVWCCVAQSNILQHIELH